MFCVECGKDGPIFRDGVCLDCYLKSNSFSNGPEFIDIPVCAHCDSFKYKNTWTSELFGDVLKKMIKNTFKISPELKKVDINTQCQEEKERVNCKVFISGFIDDVEINEEHNVFVRLKKTVCDVCSKRFGGYHEAIVQIRADKRDLTEDETNEIIDGVENLVQSNVAKGNRALFVTDMEIEHGGIDFYLSDKGFGQTIVSKIQDQHGGEVKTSSKNIGMKDSKQVYRVTYLLRLPAFRKNDFISFEESYFFISSISKNKAHLYNLSTWDEQSVDYKQIKNLQIVGGKELIKEAILVDERKDEVQIMDEKTYKIRVLKKPKPVSFNSEKIKTVNIDEQVFLFPIIS